MSGLMSPTRSPAHRRVSSMKFTMARKAMRITAMLATKEIDPEAPAEAASTMFLAELKDKVTLQKYELNHCDRYTCI